MIFASIEQPSSWRRVNDRAWFRRDPGTLVLIAMTLLLVVGIWIIRPLPVAYFATMALPLTLLLVQVSRSSFFRQFRKLGVEFSLLAVIALLAGLSVINSSEPFRCFRVIFSATVPLLVFCHYVAVAEVSREKLLLIPRLLVVAAFILSTGLILAATVIPPLKSYVMTTYRAEGLFENPIQHTIALAAVFPVLVGELAVAKKRITTLVLGCLVLLYVYTMFRAGSKMALSTSVAISLVMFIVIRLRSQSFPMTLAMFGAIVAMALFVFQFGLPIAKRIAPLAAEKFAEVIKNKDSYQSIESRKLLWNEAIRQGKLHWLIGSGAGEHVLGISHSHNLVLDYFKGTGLFGATAIVLLCLIIVTRALGKGWQMLQGIGGVMDKRIFACYCGAVIYVICNQLSDCFGPSTIAFLWAVYLAGVISDERSFSGRAKLN